MSDFAIVVNNRRYVIGCSAESEARLEQAAQEVDQHVRPLAERYGKVGDDRLLLLAALQITDELMTTREKLDEINALIAKSEELSAMVNPASEPTAEGDVEEAEDDDAPLELSDGDTVELSDDAPEADAPAAEDNAAEDDARHDDQDVALDVTDSDVDEDALDETFESEDTRDEADVA